MGAVSLHRARLDDAEFRRYQEEYGQALTLLYARIWEIRRAKPAPLRCGRKTRAHAAPAELADRVAARFDVGRSEAQRLCKAFALPYDERWAPFPIARLCTTCEACPFKSASVGCLDAGVCARSAAVLRGLDADSMAALYAVIPDEPAGELGAFPVELRQVLAEVRRHLVLSPGSPFALPAIPRVPCSPRPPPTAPRTHGPPLDCERPPRQLGPATELGIKKGLRSLPATVTPNEASSTSESRETIKPSTLTAACKPIVPRLPSDPHRSFRRNPPGYSDSQLWAELCAIRAAPSSGENLSSRLDARFNLGGYSASQICDRFDILRDERVQRPPTSTLAVGELCPTARECIRDQGCHSRLGCKNGLCHIERPQALPKLPPSPLLDSEDDEPPSAS